MADGETKVIRIIVDSSRAVDGGRAAQKALEDIERSVSGVSRAMANFESSLKGLFGAYLGMQGLQAIVNAADGFTRLTNALKVAGVASQDLAGVQDRLFAAANKNGIEIGAVGQLYSRLAQSSKELGASQDQMLKFVDGVAAAMRIQGGTAQEASGALMQLSQSFASGIVRAEEFSSVLEGATPIAQAAARGIAGMDGSIGKLRAAVNEGKITSQAFFEGLLKGFKETEVQAMKSTLTIGGGVTALSNSWTRFVGELDKTTGGTSAAVGALNDVSRVLETTRKEVEMLKKAWEWLTGGGASGGDLAGMRKEAEAVQGRIDRLHAAGPGGTLRQAELQREYTRLGVLQQGISDQMTQTYELPAVTVTAQRPPPPPPSKGAGESPEERYRKLMSELRLATEAQDAFTRAADMGGAELEKQKIHWDAVTKVAEMFGKRLGDNTLWVTELEKAMANLSAGKLRQAFIEGTKELERENDLLGLQIKLMGERPEIIAKETAALRIRQEIEKTGAVMSADEIARRQAAYETGEKLKIQQAEIAKAQELWTAPIKQALEDIQRIGADAFDKFLENGRFNFEELSKVFGTMIRRMAAEFMALATIRPVMSVLVNAVSPGMAQSMGLGTAFPGMGGSGGLGLGGAGGGGLLSPGWSSMPIFGGIDDEIAAWSAYGTPAQNAFGLSTMTWGQAAGIGGGLLGIGMGVNSLLSGGGSTGSIIGGAAGILGGGLGIAGALMPAVLGGALGPIGMGIGLLGGILPGLLGGSTPPTITNQTYAQLTYGSGGWYTTGGAWGPSANASGSQAGLQSLGGGISSVFDMLGGVRDPSKVWGLSAQNRNISGPGWSDDSTSTYLVDPNGNQQLWRMNEQGMFDTGSAQVAYRSILEGAVGDISQLMRDRLTTVGQTMGGTSLQAIADVIAEVQSFEKAMAALGQTTTGAEQALQAINDGLGSLWAYAKQHALDADVLKIERFKEEQIIAGAKAFMAPYDAANDNPLMAGLDQLGKARDAALKEAGVWNAALGTRPDLNVEQYFIDMNRITEYYLKAEKDLKEQYYRSTFGGLQDLVKSLTYGDLSGASPTDRLAGTRGAWDAAYAQAITGDQSAIARLAGLGGDYARELAGYYGTATPGYQTAIAGIRDQANGVIGANGGAGLMDVTNAGIATMSGQLADIGFKLDKANTISEEDRAMMRELLEKLTRLLAKVAG